MLAQWLSRFLVGFLTSDNAPIFVDLALDWRIFAFTAALAVATCLVFGLMPAIRVTGTAPGAAMKAGSRGSSDTRERFGLRRALVVVQVALSLVLVVGALLFVRSLRNLMTIDAGFRQDGLLVVNLDLRKAGVPAERRTALYDEITGRACRAARRDVSGAGVHRPGERQRLEQQHRRPRRAAAGQRQLQQRQRRLLQDDGDADAERADLQRTGHCQRPKRWRSSRKDSRGSTFRIRIRSARCSRSKKALGQPRPYLHIVGVVKDTKYTDLREEFMPLAFFSTSQEAEPDSGLQVVMRSAAPLATITAEVSAAVASVQSRRSSRSSRRWSRRCETRCCASA